MAEDHKEQVDRATKEFLKEAVEMAKGLRYYEAAGNTITPQAKKFVSVYERFAELTMPYQV